MADISMNVSGMTFTGLRSFPQLSGPPVRESPSYSDNASQLIDSCCGWNFILKSKNLDVPSHPAWCWVSCFVVMETLRLQ